MSGRAVAQRVALPLEQLPFAAGFLLSWSLAAPPGPANALIAHVAAQRSFAAGWITGMGAIAGDALMFTLMWFGVVGILEAFPWSRVVMGGVGALFLAFFAFEAARTALRPARSSADAPGDPTRAPDVTTWGGFTRSFVAVVTSPLNWGWWVALGATLFARLGWGIIAGFFAGLVAWTAFWSWLARIGAARIRRFREGVAIASAVVLAFFAAGVAWFALDTARALWGAG